MRAMGTPELLPNVPCSSILQAYRHTPKQGVMGCNVISRLEDPGARVTPYCFIEGEAVARERLAQLSSPAAPPQTAQLHLARDWTLLL